MALTLLQDSLGQMVVENQPPEHGQVEQWLQRDNNRDQWSGFPVKVRCEITSCQVRIIVVKHGSARRNIIEQIWTSKQMKAPEDGQLTQFYLHLTFMCFSK